VWKLRNYCLNKGPLLFKTENVFDRTKQGFTSIFKLSVFISVFAPTLIYVNECWVMTERVLSQIQAAEIGFLRRVHGVTLRDEVSISGIRKALNVESVLRLERYQLRCFGLVTRLAQERLVKRVLLATSTKMHHGVCQGPNGGITPPTGLGLVLEWRQQTYLRLLTTVRVLEKS